MGNPTKPFNFTSILLILISLLIPLVIPSPDTTKLVYRGCADQKFQDPSGLYTQTLKTLFNSLTSQSKKSNFYKTTSGNGDEKSILGVFQCRGDLSNTECYDCVSTIPRLIEQLCGEAIAARVQLNGCFLRYEVVGFKQVAGTELLYRVCGAQKVSGGGFEGRREEAFGEVEKGVVGGGGGFYVGSFGGVFYVVAQCEGDLSGGDCGSCVKTALERAKVECGDSVSAQVYLNLCYVSYKYYPNGVTAISSPGKGHNTQKTVAIIVGGVAAAGFVFVCLMFARAVLRKSRTEKH